MGFGGPVWHASASALTIPTAWSMAERALQGVGDAMLGEWRERGERAVHIRRRLSLVEQGDLTVRDIRGSKEERARIRALLHDAPYLRSIVA